MKNSNTILTEKQHYHQEKLININLTGEEIIPPDQRRMMEQAKFAYSPLERASEKHTKTIEEQRKKQVEALKVLKPQEKKK